MSNRFLSLPQTFQEKFSRLTSWQRRFWALVLGAIAALALPPVYAQPLLLVAFPGFFLLLRGQSKPSSFWIGWWFGLGYFTLSLYWIAFALGVEIDRFWWLVPLTVLGLPSLLALFTGAATFFFALFRSHVCQSRLADIILFCLFLSLFEWLRGHVLTGFPWNLLAYSWAWSLSFSQSVAYVGSYGLTFLTFILACFPLLMASQGSTRSRWLKGVAFAGAVSLLWIGGVVRLASFPTAFQDQVVLRLVQPSIPQKMKWQPENRSAIFHEMLSLSRLPSGLDVTHLIWPEASLPFFALESDFVLGQLASLAPQDGAIILGVPRRFNTGSQDLVLRNAVVALGREGNLQDVYDKQHLVPFGEYVPLRRLFPDMVTKITAGGVDYSSGEGETVLSPRGVLPARPLICYEGIFPGRVVSRGEGRPNWFLSLTNDGWFGRSFGPFQHFQMTRFRAIEEGIPLVRVANNGISGVIDPLGRVLNSLALDEKGVLDSRLPKSLAVPPLYGSYGDRVFFALLFLFGLLALLFSARKKRSSVGYPETSVC